MVQQLSFPLALSWHEKNTEQGFFSITCPAAGTANQTIQKGFGPCLIIHVTADWIQNVKGYLLHADNINWCTFLTVAENSSQFHWTSAGKESPTQVLQYFPQQVRWCDELQSFAWVSSSSVKIFSCLTEGERVFKIGLCRWLPDCTLQVLAVCLLIWRFSLTSKMKWCVFAREGEREGNSKKNF